MLKPLNERVLLEPDEVSETNSFGLIIPGQKEKPVTGTIIVGSDLVKKGDKVLFSKFGFDEVTLEKKLYYIVPNTSLLAVFE